MLAPLPAAPARLPRGGPAVLTYPVPADLVREFRSAHGVDVSDVPVHRGRLVTEHARALGARAFTSEQEIYLPDPAGSLDQPEARALLVHELTHAAQQSSLGAALPDESSAAGRLLEAQAVAAERRFVGGQGQNLPVARIAVSGQPAAWSLAQPRPRLWTADDEPAPPLRPRPLLPPLPHVQRQPAGPTSIAPTVIPAAQLPAAQLPDAQLLDALAGSEASGAASPAPPAAPPRPAGAWLAADVAAGPARIPAEAAAARRAGLAPAAEALVSAARGELAELRDRLTALDGRRPVGLDDPIALDELATRLYPRLRSKLRLELIVDRERAGLLTDFR